VETTLRVRDVCCEGTCLDCEHYGICSVVEGLKLLPISTEFKFDCPYFKDDEPWRALTLMREASGADLDYGIVQVAEHVLSLLRGARAEAEEYKKRSDSNKALAEDLQYRLDAAEENSVYLEQQLEEQGEEE
jgi:hypothetical protein